jgi:hypothetical protein
MDKFTGSLDQLKQKVKASGAEGEWSEIANGFQLAQSQQVAWEVHALSGTLLRDFVVLAQECGQPQRFQMMIEQDLRRVHINRSPGSTA